MLKKLYFYIIESKVLIIIYNFKQDDLWIIEYSNLQILS